MRATALAALLAFGCARSAPDARPPSGADGRAFAAPTVTPEELTAPPGHLELAPLTLSQNGKPELELRADGRVVRGDGRTLGTLGRDGRFLDARGELLAEFTQEGEILDRNGEYLPVTIDADGAAKLLKENRRIELYDDGSLHGANPQGPVVQVAGLTARTRRAAMFLLVLSAYPVRPRS